MYVIMVKNWDDLPIAVERNIDAHAGFDDDSVSITEYEDNINNLLLPFDATYGNEKFYFKSEAHYTWFILRWS